MIRLCPVLISLLILTSVALGDAPEDRRLDADEFRQGLKDRGLRDLLERYLEDSPPADESQGALLRRDLLLAEWADKSIPEEQRRAALEQANDILRELIRNDPKAPTAMQWRLDLAKSLLYQQAERYCVTILFRGGSDEDRRRLAPIMDEALDVLDVLLALTSVELARFDNLSLAQYERLERNGYIEQVELAEPQARYMRRWALFYRALARSDDDPLRIDELQAVAAGLREEDELLTTPHEETHLQIQCLLLSAMAQRRLGDYAMALDQLDDALSAAGRMTDTKEREALDWAVLLARLERIKALSDAKRYPEALHSIDEFRAQASSSGEGDLGLKLVAALLETSVLRSQASRAAAAGNESLARRLEEQSLTPLIALAGRADEYRDVVYATLYKMIDRQRDPATLHPFERCALIAGVAVRGR